MADVDELELRKESMSPGQAAYSRQLSGAGEAFESQLSSDAAARRIETLQQSSDAIRLASR
jgi:hypothetical protein